MADEREGLLHSGEGGAAAGQSRRSRRVKHVRVMIQDSRGRNYGCAFQSVGVAAPTKEQDQWQEDTYHEFTAENCKQQLLPGGGTVDVELDDLNFFEKLVLEWAKEHDIHVVMEDSESKNTPLTEELLRALKSDGQYPVELRDKSPKKNARGSQVKTVVVSGNPDWYDQIKVDKEGRATYWLAIELKTSNPFFANEKGCCKKRGMVNHMVKIMRIFGFVNIEEEEDQVTDEYKAMVRILLFGGKKRVAPDGSTKSQPVSRFIPEGTAAWKAANSEESRVLPFEDEMEDGTIAYRYLLLPETDDWYEVQHRNFMKNRIRLEMQSTAEYCVKLFYMSLIQFVMGWVLLGVGMIEIDGGDAAVLIASVLAGITMSVLGAPFGFLSSLSANELFIQRFMVICLMVMAFLTSFLYVELKFTYDNNNADNPSTSQLGPTASATANASTNEAKNVAALVVAIISLLVNFLNVYVAQQALDTINDLASLQDDALVFRYFQVRFTEMKRTCEQMVFAHYKQTGQDGPMSMTQFWTRSNRLRCGKKFPGLAGKTETFQSPAISCGMVEIGDRDHAASPKSQDSGAEARS
eukprot:TRINITY_DN1319_c0_g3_i1.p1 TRINITY_DN1319_c0_g3~~TRINITY_DN1319_c0_g3_i1.p1  ORF type:complete len:579 (+),score=242.81 TRINITY_DN1319_c0_g3_i1:71-1807(+)